jgi:DNA-binding response OmpR family regulator
MTEPGARRGGVLLAEDQPLVRDALTRFLEREGFAVWPAAGGAEAVQLLREHPGEIGVALVDLGMPGLDGKDTLVALRQVKPGLPCCLMTGHLPEGQREALLGLGAECVLEKPFVIADLVARLAAILRRPAEGPS